MDALDWFASVVVALFLQPASLKLWVVSSVVAAGVFVVLMIGSRSRHGEL